MLSTLASIRFLSQVCHKCSTLLKSGIDLRTSIDIMIKDEQTSAKKKALQTLQKDIHAGTPVLTALNKLTPQSHLNLDLISTHIPHLETYLEEMAIYYDNKLKGLIKTLNKATYPFILCLCTGSVAIFFMVFIAPNMSHFFVVNNTPLPLSLQWSIWFTSWLTTHGGILPLGALTGGYLIHKPLRSCVKKALSIYLPKTNSDMLWTIAILLKTGLPLHSILKSLHPSDQGTLNLKYNLENGTPPTQAIHAYYPLNNLQFNLLETSEKTGQFSAKLLELCKALKKQEEQFIQKRIAYVQPILLLLTGLFLLGIAQLLFLPLTSLEALL